MGRASALWLIGRAAAWLLSHRQLSGIPGAALTAAASLVASAQLRMGLCSLLLFCRAADIFPRSSIGRRAGNVSSVQVSQFSTKGISFPCQKSKSTRYKGGIIASHKKVTGIFCNGKWCTA